MFSKVRKDSLNCKFILKSFRGYFSGWLLKSGGQTGEREEDTKKEWDYVGEDKAEHVGEVEECDEEEVKRNQEEGEKKEET